MSLLPDDDLELVKLALEATGVALWVFDVTTGKVEWNRRMYELTGCDAPLDPARYNSFIHPDDRAMIEAITRESMTSGKFASFPHRFVRPDGQVRWFHSFGRNHFDAAGNLVRVTGGNLDVTEQRGLEDSARSAQRLETVGQLAAGISHNFNNLLATMLPAIELAAQTTHGEVRDALTEAGAAGRRAADLVRQLSTWSRGDDARGSEVEAIDALVERVVGMCRRFFEPHFAIGLELRSEGAGVKGHVAELEQAVMNLLINARDAIRDAGTPGPRIEVSSERVTRDTVRVRIRDNGPGISPEVQAHVFEPFFTTKPIGQGTGLGLSTVLATMKRHQGSVRFESEVGRGTTFDLFFPATPFESTASPPPARTSGRGEVVLIVDDEAPVRRAVARLLERSGYVVRHAEDDVQALAEASKEPAPSAVLLDQSMPWGHGALLVPRLRALLPQLPIFFHTGHEVSDAHRALVDGVLLKPISPERLLSTLQAVASKT